MSLRALVERAVSGNEAVLVVVSKVEGSVPRGEGTWMMVFEASEEGSIGGGELEYQAIGRARRMLIDKKAWCHFEDITLGPDVGQCCGGRVVLIWQKISARGKWWQNGAGHYLCLPDGGGTQPRVVSDFQKEGVCIGLEDINRNMLIFGAGHVGRMVAMKGEGLGWQVELIDNRATMFESGVGFAYPPCVKCHCCEDVLEFVKARDIGDSNCVLVMTHSHDLDYAIMREILRKGSTCYIGLIGSKTKAARFRQRLRLDGVGDAALSRLHSPVGLEGVRGKERNIAEIAISIWAEIVREVPRCQKS